MRVIIQRVSNANVSVDKKIIGEIQKGFLVLLGVGPDDDKEDISYLVRKITNMRIFEDENGKMNRSILDVGGSILVISQFTLFADCRKGNRPSFTSAGAPEMSKQLYFDFIDALTESGIHTEKGSFGADMDVSLINQGPVTIFLDSKDR